MITQQSPVLTYSQRLLKRTIDIIVSLLLIALLFPIMLLVAVAIRLDSQGSILLQQGRIGENGRAFKMFKFRSMIADAQLLQRRHPIAGQRFRKTKDDPRITCVGRLIRRTSLDELPQLFNVLRGDMSIVGPRPELPWVVERYETWQLARFSVPQGITGWWQINGRSDKPMYLHTEDDLYYVQNYSLRLDCLILLKTPLVVVRGTGAY